MMLFLCLGVCKWVVQQKERIDSGRCCCSVMSLLVCSGELYKLGGGGALSRLQKRYFELRDNGALTYFDRPGGEEKGVIYVEGAKVVDRGTYHGKLCFSIEGVNLSKGVKEYFLYTDDASVKWLWYQNIQKLTKRYNFDDDEVVADSAADGVADLRLQRSPVYAPCIAEQPWNQACCDCGSPNPTWAVVKPYGCFVCIECIGVHRSLWAGLCKEVELDKWSDDDVQYMASRGNRICNAELEYCVPLESTKPNRWSARPLREAYITAKYRELLFTAEKNEGKDPQPPAAVDTATRTDLSCAVQSAAGAPPKYIGVAFVVLSEANGYAYNGAVAVLTNGFQEVRGKPGVRADSTTTRWNETLQVGVDNTRRPLYITLYEGDSKIAATAEIILSDVLGNSAGSPTLSAAGQEPSAFSVALTGKAIGESHGKAYLHGKVSFVKLT